MQLPFDPNAQTYVSQVCDITPEMAAYILKHHSQPNREIRRSNLAYLRANILRDWQLTHQGIAFHRGGKLYDGYHRLTVLSEVEDKSVSVKIPVTCGVTEDAYRVVDSGFTRSVSDRLKDSAVNASVYNMAARALLGKMQRYSTDLLEEIRAVLQAPLSRIRAVCLLKQRAAVLLGLSYMIRIDPDYADTALANYGHMMRGDFEKMSNTIVQFRAALLGRVQNADYLKVFAMTCKVFDRKLRPKQTLVVGDVECDTILYNYREYMTSILPDRVLE